MEKEPKFKESTLPSFTEEQKKYIEELEKKKQVRRENRLKKIVEKNSELLQSLLPEEADNFEITYEEIKEREDSTLEETVKISSSNLPAYGIFLKPKFKPETDSEEGPEIKHQIMHWLRPDLDAKKKEFDMLLNQSLEDEIQEGIEELKSKEESKK